MKTIAAVFIIFGGGLIYTAIDSQINNECTTEFMWFVIVFAILMMIAGFAIIHIINISKSIKKDEENLIEKQNNYGGNRTTKNLSRKIYSNV